MAGERPLSEYSLQELRSFISSVPSSGSAYEAAVERLGELSEEVLYKLLNKKQRAFLEAYSKEDCTIKEAARAAGLSDSSDAVLCSAGSRMLKNVKVAAYRRARAREECKILNLSRSSYLLRLNDLATRARKDKNLKSELGALKEIGKVIGASAPEKTDTTITVQLGAGLEEFAE